MKDHYDKKAYNPEFKWGFIHPKYWGTWLAVLIALPFALLPNNVRRVFATFCTNILLKSKSGANKRARINLTLCFPEKTDDEREVILRNMYITAATFLMGFASVSLRSKQWLAKNSEIKNEHYLTSLTEAGENVILLVPHTWAIDIPAILLASRGLPVSAMAKRQKNEVLDWLMHVQRVQYGGRVYEREGGIKPFIKSIRDGYLGYYLPDEDLGPDHSVFVDFFATTKATMAGLGKLSKVSRAKIVPLFAMYNAETGKFEIEVLPALEPFPNADEDLDARAMNIAIETFVNPRPEQYMWILKLLKTQKDGVEPYVL